MNDSASSHRIKFPELNKGDTFETWWLQFYTFASLKGYVMALEENFPNKLPDVHDTTLKANETGKKETIIANQCAMAALSILLKRVEDIVKIYKTVSQKRPAGVSLDVIKLLKAKYQPIMTDEGWARP